MSSCVELCNTANTVKLRAARSAFWLAFTIIDVAGHQAQAGGWLARAQRQLQTIAEPTAEHGLLLCAQAFQNVGAGDVVTAHAAFSQAAELGLRFGDVDLLALARHGEARVLIRQNDCAAGVAILDDVRMVRVEPKDLATLKVGRVPRMAGVQNGRPLLADGRTLDVANVIWCTGFHAGFSWIDLPVFAPDGEPLHERGFVPSSPGHYFLGLEFLYALSSAMILGVRRDAKRIASAIARDTTSRAAA